MRAGLALIKTYTMRKATGTMLARRPSSSRYLTPPRRWSLRHEAWTEYRNSVQARRVHH